MVSLCADVCTEKTSQHIPIYLSTCIVERVNVITCKGFKKSAVFGIILPILSMDLFNRAFL